MHRFASQSILRRLKWASWFLLLLLPAVLTLLAMLIWGFLLENPRGLQGAMVLLFIIPALGAAYALTGFSVRCPLCRGPVLRRSGASMNSRYRPAFGSARLTVAFRALCCRDFRCPYCGEPVDLLRTRRN
ncbi:MAG: hypothetical protein ACQKBU_06120 [Verrucomicrobiales bacterium]